MSGIDRARLKAILNERGRSARDVSIKSGQGETAVKQILNGSNKKPSLEALLAIAAEIRVPLSDFADLESVASTKAVRQRQVVPQFLPVRFRAAAGVWQAVDGSAQDFPEPPQAVVPDARYAEWPQWLEIVEGPSMDLVIRPGSYAHVVDALEMGYSPRHLDIVIVERQRNGGELLERTVKEVRRTAGAIELWPRSSDERYQAPVIVADNDETTEVRIVGLVIGAYSSFGRQDGR